MQTPARTGPALWLVAIFLINFLSLVYQVVWVRKIMLVFGTTALSISTVLTVFLGGIALGGYLGGIWIKKIERKYRFAGIILVLLGAYCLLSNYLFGLIRYPFLFMSGTIEDPLSMNLLKFFFSFVILILPTTAIGLMFPVTTYLYSIEFKRLGRDVASIYFLDTLGAALGALVCGFFLVPTLGLATTSAISAAIYMLLGLLVFRKDRAGPAAAPAPEAPAPPTPPTPTPVLAEAGASPASGFKREHYVILAAVCLSGFAALLLEVAWARYFHLIFGTSIYAFSLVVAAFLMGLSVGSVLVHRFLDGIKNPMLVFAYVEVLIAGLCLIVLQTSGALEAYYFDFFKNAGSFYGFQAVLFLAAFFLMLMPTALMGANFPLAVRLFARSGETRGRDAGLIFSINTAGGVIGAFAAGFIIIPRLGLEATSVLAACVYLLIGLGLLAFSARRLLVHAAVVVPLMALFVLFGVRNYGEPSLGVSVYYNGVRYDSLEGFLDLKERMKTLYSKQGYYGLVSVHEDPKNGIISLQNNGKTDASTGIQDMKTQLMLAHLALFVHPEPRHVLNIGLGGGFTVGSIALHPEVEKIDTVEIDPLVVEAVELFFSPYIYDALSDPRVKVIIDDGRHYLYTTKKKYDIIVSEPPNIWVSGVSQLFTSEFYGIVEEHLYDGGILAQWIPGYEMEPEDLSLILATIRKRFRHVGYWRYNTDILILASQTLFNLDAGRIEKVIGVPEVAADLAKVFDRVDVESVYELLTDVVVISPEEDDDKLITRVNTDDLPYLEFKTARNIFNKARGSAKAPSPE